MLCRDGRVITRPGFKPLTTTAPTSNRVMGGVYYVNHLGQRRIIIGTTLGFHLFDGTSWSDISGPALTSGAGDQVRFGVFPFSNSTKIVAVNDVDAPQVSNNGAAFAALGGSPPIAKCVTTAFQRMILGNVTVSGTRRASALWISGFQSETDWSSTREVNLTDTQDSIVEAKSLNSQMFAIYKDHSQWVGIGAGGLFPFVFELRDQQPGPVAPAAVVQAENDHYYVGQDGDVYRFDGNRCVAIGGAARRLIQADLDQANLGRTHGFYDPTNREIWWLWPSYKSNLAVDGIVYRLPYEDVPAAFSPLMVYGLLITASVGWRDTATFGWNDLTGTWDALGTDYPTWDDFPNVGRIGALLGMSTGVVHRFAGSANDNGSSFDAYFDLPFRAVAGVGENVRVDAIESFFKRMNTSPTVQIILLTSDTMGSEGTAVTAQTIDTTEAATTKHRATYADQQARFVAIRHRLLTITSQQEYRGGVLYAFRRGEQ